MKIKAKEKDGIVKVKVMVKHHMLTYDKAEAKGLEANFITSLLAKVDDKTVYELSSSQFLSKNPLFKFQFYGKKGKEITLEWRDLSGQHIVESKKIK